MAKIIEAAPPRRVRCRECQALIEYLPEDVRTHTTPYTFFHDSQTWRYVPCPRPRCPGRGIISIA